MFTKNVHIKYTKNQWKQENKVGNKNICLLNETTNVSLTCTKPSDKCVKVNRTHPIMLIPALKHYSLRCAVSSAESFLQLFHCYVCQTDQ